MSIALSATETASLAEARTAIRATGIVRTIDDRIILNDISFAVDPGRYIALLGANGAGKSTLLKIIATLIPPTQGELLLFDSPVRANQASTRRRIGFIGHGLMMYRDLSPFENLVFFAKLFDMPDPAGRARELLQYVNLTSRADDPIKTFSRGMMQRAAIARALVHDPDLILADEPFSGLDAPSRRTVEEMLARLHDEGKTIILANHDVAQSLQLAQQVLVLRYGRLVIDASAAGLDPERISRGAILDMTRAIRQIGLLTAKDLRIEARTRQTIGLVAMLGVLIIVVLAMGLGSGRPVSGLGATSVLWVAYLFGGVLCFEKTMTIERYDEAPAGLLIAPVDRGVIYISKLLTNLTLMAGLALVVTPIAVLLFRFELLSHALEFAAVTALGMLGFAAVGTLFAAAVSSSRLQGGLLALLVFPLSLPVIIVSTQLMRRLFQDGGSLSSSGLATLVAFDLIFLIVSWLVFELVLEP